MAEKHTTQFLNQHRIFRFTTQRPVAITMIVLAVVVFGWISYQQLSLNLMPNITYPSLTVRTEYPGAAPEEVETAISRPIEEALGVVTNLVSITSISKAGQSDVILEFNWDTDMNDAMGEVREKLDLVFLPEDADRPIILRYDPSLDPIIRLGLTGGRDLFFTRYVAEETVKRTLETLPGVAAVKVIGGLEEEIRIELNEQQLTLLGLDIQQVRQRLSQENVNLAGGELKEGQTAYIVRTLNEFRSVDEIIARVYRTHKDREIITRLNGQESVELEVYKEGDANIVEVARRVREKIFGTPEQQAYVARMNEQQQKPTRSPGKMSRAERRKMFMEQLKKKQMTDFLAYRLPKGMHLSLLTDQSVFIKNSIDEVKKTALQGGLLAVIVLFLFLNNFRNTLIVGLAIPISIIATFGAMKLFNVSLNIMSLGGLALGIGMLVDNAIVVTESIYRCREEGDDFLTSVIRGTSEVGPAVIASTLTTIAVFFPIVFVQGVAGQIFGDLALTVVFSLLASLAVALFVIPMLASRRVEIGQLQTQWNPARFFTRFEEVGQFKVAVQSAVHAIRQTSGARRGLYLVIFPIHLVYAVFRSVVQLVLALLGRIMVGITLVFGAVVGVGIKIWNRLVLPIIQWIVRGFNQGMGRVYRTYPVVLHHALQRRGQVVGVSLLLFVLTLWVVLPRLGSELIPQVHQGEFNVDITLPVGTPVEATVQRIAPVEEFLLSLPTVTKVATVAGIDKTKINDSEAGEHTARLTVTLTPGGNLQQKEEAGVV